MAKRRVANSKNSHRYVSVSFFDLTQNLRKSDKNQVLVGPYLIVSSLKLSLCPSI